MRAASRMGFVVVIPLLAMCSLIAPHVHHRDTVPVLPAVTSPHSMPATGGGAWTDEPARPEADDEAGTVDLYGNQVTDAVAKYQLDSQGSLYELHSPRTELPRLGSPKS